MKLNFFIFQKKTIVGDIKKNFLNFKRAYKKAEKKKCDFFITSELALCGYPPKDLMFRNDFIKRLDIYKNKIINFTQSKKTIFVLGTIIKENSNLYNAAVLIRNGKVINEIKKTVLPNDGVFDEKRYFSKSNNNEKFFLFKNKNIRFLICEDIWNEGLTNQLCEEKTDFLIVLNASPYEKNKFKKRFELLKKRVKQFGSPILYVNSLGGQDDLVFDGGSFCINTKQKIIFQAPFFQNYEDGFIFNEKKEYKVVKYKKNKNFYDALTLSLRDYVNNSNFSSIILGISGGIDSALSATIACDAVGKKNVKGFFLPSLYTSKESKEDSENLSKNLGIELETIEIESLREKYNKTLSKTFSSYSEDITEENIQSRIRGSILMALSNKFGSLLLTTGNKSEFAVGYSTIYGDMCGGFSILKDVYKSEVFMLSKWRNKVYTEICLNKEKGLIPQNIILKEPTAELRFNQKDTDSLPSYDILDEILYLLIEKNLGLSDLEKKGYDKGLVIKIWKMLTNSEFKRFQSIVGPKVSSMSFDSERRFPLVNKFLLEDK